MNILQKYGIKLLEINTEINKSYKNGFIKNDLLIDCNIQEIITELKLLYHNNLIHIDIDNYNIAICPKINNQGFFMKWHLDDAQVIHHKYNIYNKNKTNFEKNQIFISSKKTVYYPNNNIPKYSMIIYLSTYNKDFNGGIFEFCNGIKIKPQKNMFILFDSRYVHCVHKITAGIRKSILIKFYEK